METCICRPLSAPEVAPAGPECTGRCRSTDTLSGNEGTASLAVAWQVNDLDPPAAGGNDTHTCVTSVLELEPLLTLRRLVAQQGARRQGAQQAADEDHPGDADDHKHGVRSAAVVGAAAAAVRAGGCPRVRRLRGRWQLWHLHAILQASAHPWLDSGATVSSIEPHERGTWCPHASALGKRCPHASAQAASVGYTPRQTQCMHHTCGSSDRQLLHDCTPCTSP